MNKFLNKKLLYLLPTGLCLLAVAVTTAVGVHLYNREQRLQQPIHFPHETHAGKLKLACTKCHTTVTNSPVAGMPPLSVCMECHTKVKIDSPEIKILTEHWNTKTPVEWDKIHELPWHVRFNHKRHIAKFGSDASTCAICHGEVKTMTQVHQVRSLEMGWCVRCHRANDAPTDCWTCHK
jgi:hypothetical protein